MSDSNRWRPERTADGSWTLVSRTHDEACHSRAGAWTQALERYARPCKLRELARSGATNVRLLEIGTGVGWNLAAALAELDESGATLDAVSLELDRSVLCAALELPIESGESARPWTIVRGAFETALASDSNELELALGDRGRLRLRFGDARDTIRRVETEPGFTAVFLDPFSPRVNSELWSDEFLFEVGRRVAEPGLLSTYSSALAVRVGLARAGLSVGLGPRVGTKASGTLASRGVELPPLDARTSRRLTRKSVLDANPTSMGESRPRFA